MFKQCLSKFKWTIAFYLSNGLVQVVVSMMAIVYFQRVIDSIPTVGGSHGISHSLTLLAIYGILQLSDYVLNYIDNFPSSRLGNGFHYYFKLAAMRKLSTIDYLRYQDYGTGRLMQMVEAGAQAGRDILFQYYLRIARELLPELAFGMVFIGIYNTTILLVIAASYVLVFIISQLLLKRLHAIKKATLIDEESFMGKAVRAFMEMVVFRIHKRFKAEVDACNQRAERIIQSKTKILTTHEMFFTAFAVIVAIIKIVVIYIGIHQVVAGTATVGYIMAVVLLIDRIYTPIAIFNVEYIDFKMNKVAYGRYQKFMNQPDDPQLHSGQNIMLTEGRIQLSDVSFRYHSTPILEDIQLDLTPGQTYLLAGLSGTGKTTLLNLVAGLLKPERGSILIDDQDLSIASLNSYYDHIAYLTQNPPVFDGSVRENLAFDHAISDERLWDVLQRVHLDEDIRQLPHGLDTSIGEKGGKLSGGQRQRLAMARIILSPPPIILLDEATSALDAMHEQSVMTQLFDAARHSTILSVTHRLALAPGYDRVILLVGTGIDAIKPADQLQDNVHFQQLLHQPDVLHEIV